jgi:hypothetical protein
MPATTLCINNILNYNFGGTAYAETLPAIMYFGLSTTLVTISSTGATVAEPSGGSYARKSFTNNNTNWSTSAAGTLHNDVAVAFIESTAAWGTMLSIFISDSATTAAGNIWWFYTLSPSIIVPDNTIVTFPIGSIVVTMI